MAERANPELRDELAAAFAWWREAGVDCAFKDETASWMTPREDDAPSTKAAGTGEVVRPAAAPTSPAPAVPAIDPASLPRDLAAFADWWLAEPLLDEGRMAGRVAPRGEAGAEVMVIVPEPEREDTGHLLSGPQGQLLDAILAAMGFAPGQVYFASALPRHTPMADWAAAATRGLGGVLVRHVELTRPRRLIAFGGNVLSLLGHDPPNTGQFSSQFNHGGQSIPTLAATELGVMLARPRAKARLWQQWLDWTGPDGMGS